MGQMGAGKTYIVDHMLANNHSTVKIAFADKLKEDIIALGLTPDGRIEKPRDRQLLQNYGQLRRGEINQFYPVDNLSLFNFMGKTYRRDLYFPNTPFSIGECYPNYWVDQLMDKVKNTISNVIIEDVRRFNEAEAVRKHGFCVIKLECALEARLQRLLARDGSFNRETLTDISESEVDALPCYAAVKNETTLDYVTQEIHKAMSNFYAPLGYENN